MPATAGRVRMPANNRVHSSAALQTHGIWQSAIGYDPYAPNKEESKGTQAKASVAEPEGGENSYASFQGLLALARITNTNTDVARGACPKCGRVGHLKYQCRNFLSLKDEKEKELNGVPALTGLDGVKGGGGKSNGKRAGDEDSEESSEESESSDSDVDLEMERLIAERYGNKQTKKGNVSKKKEYSESDLESDDSREKRKKKRGRSVKRRSGKRGGSDSDEDDSALKRRKREKRKKRYESSDDEEERRRRHRKSRRDKRRKRSQKESDDSADRKHKRRSRRAASPSDSDSNSDDSRIGRRQKRAEKRSRKHRREDDD
ncbi:unnamed protein product [Rhodiola kirilowii]